MNLKLKLYDVLLSLAINLVIFSSIMIAIEVFYAHASLETERERYISKSSYNANLSALTNESSNPLFSFGKDLDKSVSCRVVAFILESLTVVWGVLFILVNIYVYVLQLRRNPRLVIFWGFVLLFGYIGVIVISISQMWQMLFRYNGLTLAESLLATFFLYILAIRRSDSLQRAFAVWSGLAISYCCYSFGIVWYLKNFLRQDWTAVLSRKADGEVILFWEYADFWDFFLYPALWRYTGSGSADVAFLYCQAFGLFITLFLVPEEDILKCKSAFRKIVIKLFNA